MIEELDLRVLKAITTDKVNALTFAYRFDHTLFDQPAQNFAKLALDYTKTFRSPPTKRTLLDRHKGNSLFTSEIEYVWNEIESYECDIAEYPYDLQEMKKRFQMNAVDVIRRKAAEEDPDNPENPEDYFNKLSLEISRVTSLDLERTHTQRPVGDYVDEFLEKYETRKQNPESTIEIKTGYSMIDELSGGFSPSELFIIGGESGQGKSQCLLNLAKQMWLQGNKIDTPYKSIVPGKNVLYLSLEMPYEDCFDRFMSTLVNVPNRPLRKSSLNPEEESRLKKAGDFIKRYQEMGYYFDIVDVPRGVTVEDMELRYQDALLKYRPEIVIVDYLGLMDHKAMSNEPDWLKLGAISASLHEFGRVYDCIVGTAAQLTDLKRGANSSQEEARRVGMHRWGRSSLIMHNVNFAIQIETRLNEESFPDLKVHVVKNRKGPVGHGSWIKNFSNSSVVDIPYDKKNVLGDISANIPDLIKSIQEAKNKEKEAKKDLKRESLQKSITPP